MEETVAAEARKSKLGPHGQVKCLSCCKVFKSYSSLEAHLKSKHDSVNSEWRRLQEAKVEGRPKVEKRNKPQLVLGDLIKLGARGRPDKASTTAALSAYYGEKPSRTSEAPKVVAAGKAPPLNSIGATSKAFAWRIGKERLGPKKVKLTNLKRIILREREARKLRAGDLDSAPTLAADGDSAKPCEEERVGGQRLPMLHMEHGRGGGREPPNTGGDRGANEGEGNLGRSGGEVQDSQVGSLGETCEADESIGEVDVVHSLSESPMGTSLGSACCEVRLHSSLRIDLEGLHLAGGSEGVTQGCQVDCQAQAAGMQEPGAAAAEVACGSGREGAEGDSHCVGNGDDDDAGDGGKRRRRRRRHRKVVEAGIEGESKAPECGPGSSEERVEQGAELTYLSALRGIGKGGCESSSSHGACSGTGTGTGSVASARGSSGTPGSFSACEPSGDVEEISQRKRRGERRRRGPKGVAAKESVVMEVERSEVRESAAGGAAVEVSERRCESSRGREEQGTDKDACEVEEGHQVEAQTSGALLPLATGQPHRPETLPPPTPTYIGPNVHIRYCKQVISPELNSVTLQLLTDLSRFQERARNKDPIKAKQKQRLTVGMREVARSIRTQRAKCIIVAPNIEEVAAEGGLDDLLGNLLAQAEANHMSIIFALTRSRIAQALGHRKVKMSCVALCDYDGANALYKEMCSLAQKGREEWAALHSNKGI